MLSLSFSGALKGSLQQLGPAFARTKRKLIGNGILHFAQLQKKLFSVNFRVPKPIRFPLFMMPLKAPVKNKNKYKEGTESQGAAKDIFACKPSELMQ